jgi:hypothetical protein
MRSAASVSDPRRIYINGVALPDIRERLPRITSFRVEGGPVPPHLQREQPTGR